jgi:hypothetical protein
MSPFFTDTDYVESAVHFLPDGSTLIQHKETRQRRAWLETLLADMSAMAWSCVAALIILTTLFVLTTSAGMTQ